DGVSEYAYLDGVTDDPVTQGTVGTIPPEAKMLCAATAQLTVGHASGITDAGFVVSKTVNGYSQIFDDIVMNWSSYSGVTGYERLAEVEKRARTEINAGTGLIKERLSLVNRGTINTATPANNSVNKPDTDCVAFFDGYSRVDLQVYLPAYIDGQFTATGIKISIPDNLTLYT
ncbi:MAG: hypothetical protein JW915_19630, partial [Chitinispirillaceae bacterium]|nr:hypothetical protein [Chitinispirillaceae bacterium]